MKFLIFIFLANFIYCSNKIDDLNFYTEEYPPYNYYNEEMNSVDGIFIDVLKYIFSDNNTELDKENINLITWARAYNLTLLNDNSVIFALTKNEERENLFKLVGPVINTKIVLTAKKNKKIKIENINDIENFKVGLIKDGIALQTIEKNNIDNKNFDVGQSQLASAKKLVANRIDIWAYEERVARSILKSIDENLEDYESIYTIKDGFLYFGFNKNIDDEIIDKFQNSLDKLKTEDIDEFENILRKYK